MQCDVIKISQPSENSLKAEIQTMLDDGWSLVSVNMTGEGFACRAFLTFTK
jgi:hypothetical protein